MARSLRASKVGIEKAKRAFELKGWTQDYLAGAVGCSRQIVGKFMARQSVEKRLFQRICEELGCELGDIADFNSAEQESSQTLNMNSLSQTAEATACKSNQEQIGTTGVLTAPVVSQKEVTKKAIFVLSGSIDEADEEFLKAFVAHLRIISGDATLTVQKVEEGSIKITLEGSPDGIDRLIALFNSGELTDVLNIPVEDVQLVKSDSIEEDKNTAVDDASQLEKKVVTHDAEGRNLVGANPLRGNLITVSKLILNNLGDGNLKGAYRILANLRGAKLSGVDLRDANLRGANLRCTDLRGANLRCTDLSAAELSSANLCSANLCSANLSSAKLIGVKLIGANLSGANLSGADLYAVRLIGANLSDANLSYANLSDANLRRANLSGANLKRADLSRANLSGADVNKSRFGNNQGISDSMKLDLIERGAIFDEPPRERSGVLVLN